MPRIRPGQKPPPEGFELVNDELDQFEDAMRSAMHATPLTHAKPTLITRQSSKPGAFKPSKDNMPAYLASIHKEHAYSSSESESDDDDDTQLPSEKAASSGTPNTANPPADTQDAITPTEQEDCGGDDQPTEVTAADPFAALVAATPPMWTVARINRERTRFVYDMHYKQKKISREVLDYCCEMNFVDAGLVRRWRVPGYERLCCVHCAAPGVASGLTSSTSSRAVQSKKAQRHGDRESVACICRVPRSQRRQHLVACMVCGCSGCCSGDAPDTRSKPHLQSSNPTAQHGEGDDANEPSIKRTRTED